MTVAQGNLECGELCPVCCAVPNQDVCQLHDALEALNQPQDFPSTFTLPKLYVWWIYWENDSCLG